MLFISDRNALDWYLGEYVCDGGGVLPEEYAVVALGFNAYLCLLEDEGG
jgi:hypothetical protein